MSGDEGSFNGPIWQFQSNGILPFENGRLHGVQRPDVDLRALEEMDPEREEERLEGNQKEGTTQKNTWERLEKPSDTHGVSISERSDLGLVPTSAIIGSDELHEMKNTDEEIRLLDKMKEERDSIKNGVPMPGNPVQRDALSSLEDDLADLDI
jgi:hypothetical protein